MKRVKRFRYGSNPLKGCGEAASIREVAGFWCVQGREIRFVYKMNAHVKEPEWLQYRRIEFPLLERGRLQVELVWGVGRFSDRLPDMGTQKSTGKYQSLELENKSLAGGLVKWLDKWRHLPRHIHMHTL